MGHHLLHFVRNAGEGASHLDLPEEHEIHTVYIITTTPQNKHQQWLQWVTHLLHFVGDAGDGASHLDLPEEQELGAGLHLHAQQAADVAQQLGVLLRQRALLALHVLEAHVAQHQHGRQHGEDAPDHVLRDVQHVHGQAQVVEHGQVVDAGEGVAAALVEVVVGVDGADEVLLGQLGGRLGPGDQLVEDVVVALVGRLEGDAWLLQQVVLHDAPFDLVAMEAHLHELAEAARVVVAHRLGVACTKDKINLKTTETR